MKQDAAFFQINRAARGFERKHRVRPDSCNGIVRRGQFHARRRSGADAVGRFEQFICLCRGGGLCGSGDDFGVIDDFGENTFGQRRGGVRCEPGNTNKQSQKKNSDFNVCSGVLGLRPSLHLEMTCQRINRAKFFASTRGATAANR